MSESRSYATIRAAGLLLAAAIGAALLASSVPATVATPEEAARVSQNWLTYMVYQQGNWAGEKAPQLLGSEEITFQGMVVGYHFRVAPSGYIVVPVLKE
ncbi:MAG TPA: hypothetical protein PKW75_11785, partial [candidate division Zixibacteria bacterium]|nr:hypothetical protein [candidate division Zixibacteria bacterium]